MILNKNNNQGIFLELLAASKKLYVEEHISAEIALQMKPYLKL